jgi:predicted transcriptional regulator of viral defense system
MQVVERAIAAIAGRQDNVITREQLLEAGLGRGAIAHRVQAGAMQRMHRGVYLIGPAPPTPMARARAAALSCGHGAIVSHRSAAELDGTLSETDHDVDVTVVGRNPGAHPAICLHRVAHMPREEVVIVRALKITSTARTISDLAATESPRTVEIAFQEALYRRRDIDRAVAAVLAREPHRRGAPVIRSLRLPSPT